jgi:hypothetical protein
VHLWRLHLFESSAVLFPVAAEVDKYPPEYVPKWGRMQFFVNILRPLDPSQTGNGSENWFSTLKRAGGGCNDLVYSGHMYVAVLTAMAWTV